MTSADSSGAVDTKPVRYEVVEGHVALITMNRPEKRNAINAAMAAALEDAALRAEQEQAVGAVVLTSSGDTFCAGADLAEVAAGRSAQLRTERGGFAGLVDRPESKPWIAAIGGAAVAGGFEIALSCDIIMAAPQAFFALPEVKRGLIAGAGGVYRLPRLLPPNIAKEMILSGAGLPAERGWQLGLVNHLVEREALLAAALWLARQIAANAPLAVRESLRVTRAAIVLGESALAAVARDASRRLVDTEDAREGARAFVEKRPAVWKGR